MSAQVTRAQLYALSREQNVAAFLHAIRLGEGTEDDAGYSRLFGGAPFDGFDDHPRQRIKRGRLTSTAAGAYQILSRTWDEMAAKYGFHTFYPLDQDAAAVGLLLRRGALEDVRAGRIIEAVAKCCREWASLPGAPYGQPTVTVVQFLKAYRKHDGRVWSDPPAAPP